MESNTTEASRLALSYAMDLAQRAQGQAWGAEAVTRAAKELQAFLLGSTPGIEERIASLSKLIDGLYERVDTLEASLTPPPSKRAATNTTPPKPDAQDIPDPVDF